MKRLILLIAALLSLSGQGYAQKIPREVYAALRQAESMTGRVAHEIEASVQEVETLTSEQQRQLAEQLRNYSYASQALEEARQAKALQQFELSAAQRTELEKLYKEYRRTLAESTDMGPDLALTREMGNTELLRYLKEKLAAISAAAEVKRQYVDKFAEILSAEQIRELYNTEGQLAEQLKAAAAGAGNDRKGAYSATGKFTRRGNFYTIKPFGSNKPPHKIKGSKRLISQNLGEVNNYTGILADFNISVTVSSSAREMTLTADDNLMDYISVVCENGRIQIRINVATTENISISAVIPYSPELRELSASGYGKIVCDEPLHGTKDMSISAIGGSKITADAVTTGKIRLEVSGYSKFSGDIAGSAAMVTISGGATSEGDITASEKCAFMLSGYANYNGQIRAYDLQAEITGGAGMHGSVHATTMRTQVAGYAKMHGTIEADSLTADVSGGAQLDTDFRGKSIQGNVSGYAHMNLRPLRRNPEPVETATLTLTGGSVFSAPALPLSECRITVSGYAKADLYCTGTLRTSVSSSSKITYSGPCQVFNENSNVRRR